MQKSAQEFSGPTCAEAELRSIGTQPGTGPSSHSLSELLATLQFFQRQWVGTHKIGPQQEHATADRQLNEPVVMIARDEAGRSVRPLPAVDRRVGDFQPAPDDILAAKQANDGRGGLAGVLFAHHGADDVARMARLRQGHALTCRLNLAETSLAPLMRLWQATRAETDIRLSAWVGL